MRNLKPIITAAVIIAVFIIGAVAMAQFNKTDKQTAVAADTVTAAEKVLAAPPDGMMPPGMPPGGPGGPGGPMSEPGGITENTGSISSGPGSMSGGPGRGGHKPGMIEPVSSDDVKEFEAWMKKEDPEGYNEILEIKAIKPMEYGRIVFEYTRNMRIMKVLEKKDPEAYRGLKDEMMYDVKLRKLCRQYRDAKQDIKNKIKTELTETLNKLFDIRTANRQREIGKLEDRVKELRTLLEKRKANKKLIVDRKLSEVTGSSDGLEW